jgi:hypothetical protein
MHLCDPFLDRDYYFKLLIREQGAQSISRCSIAHHGDVRAVLSSGGALPTFAQNGRDLFFYDATNDRVTVASYLSKRDALVAEKPRAWSNQGLGVAINGGVGAQYDVSADGKRIAAAYAGDSTQPGSGHDIFLENFVDELQRRIPPSGK